jgi:hypothetical protein
VADPNEVTSPVRMNSSLRIGFAIASLLFCASTIVWVVLYGKADNSLHASALSWSYCVAIGTLGALGFGSIIELVPLFFGKK